MTKFENIEPDPSISNGTCFYAPRKEASSNFIPCGNWVFGHVQCCQIGDKCLSHNACYNNRYGTTYLAGCSRFDFDDPSCPDKKSYKDYPWAGLIYCRPNRWMACEEEGKPELIRQGDECTCPSSSETMTVAFSAPNVLEDIALLPNAHGGTIEWFANHLPTTETTSTTSSSTWETTTDSATTTSTSTPSNIPLPTPPNLSTGAKAGIGIGSAVGAILLFGALSALWMVFRRRRRRRTDKSSSTNSTPSNPETGATGPTDKPSGGSGSLPEMPAPDVPPRPAYSELPVVVGPWVVRPEPQGDGSGASGSGVVTPYSGASSPPLPVSPASLGEGLGEGQGQWGNWGSASGPVQQGQGQWTAGAGAVAGGERSRQGQGVALELPA